MKQSIIRVAKIKTRGAALGKTKHNYRLMDTPNADPERTASLNEEYLNHGQRDYWSLAEERIGEAVTRKVRDDQVRAMEVLLTASPEWFERGADGQAKDMRGSKWVDDNLHFLQERYGARNVVSFTLHQDEKTPHIHAVVIPITETGRLSADILFNPRTLKQLQTDYAMAMADHGLERGMEGSRRPHQEMKQVYGRQDTTAAELAPLVQTPAAATFRLETPPLIGREAWKEAQEAKINAEIARQVGEVTKRLQEVGSVAVAQAGAQDQAQALDGRLRKSEGLNQRNYQVAVRLQQELAQVRAQLGQFAVDLVQRKSPSLDAIKLSERTLAEGAKRAETVAREVINRPFRDQDGLFAHFAAAGYRVEDHAGPYGPVKHVEEVTTGFIYPLKQLIPDWDGLVAERIRQEGQRREQDLQQREQARKEALAQAPGARNAYITAEHETIERIKVALASTGANIWGESSTDDYTQLRISYQHQNQSIQKINSLIEQAQLDPRVSEVHESPADKAARREAVRFLSTPLGQEIGRKGKGLDEQIERD